MGKAKLFIDSQNIKRGAKKSLGIIVDFTRVRKILRELCSLSRVDLKPVAICEGIYPEWVERHDKPGIRRLGSVRESVFREMSFLRKQGFETVLKELRYESGRFFQKGVDVQMAVDMVMAVVEFDYDLVIMGSGDEDFIPAMEPVKRRGAELWIAAVGANISGRMIAMADRFVRPDDYKNRIKALRFQ